jgi:hypothetical protein
MAQRMNSHTPDQAAHNSTAAPTGVVWSELLAAGRAIRRAAKLWHDWPDVSAHEMQKCQKQLKATLKRIERFEKQSRKSNLMVSG